MEDIRLVIAAVEDADLIHKIKYESFLPLYEKYHDDETSPVKESKENIIGKLNQEFTDYYLIKYKDVNVGAVRVRKKRKGLFYISPLFILPEYQNKGIGYKTIQKLFGIYPEAVTWRLDTILQEKRSCHLYEKCGFKRTGKEKQVNEFMTLVDYEKTNVEIRLFSDSDAEEVAALVARNFKEINIKDYGESAINKLLKTHDASWVRQVAGHAHMYLFCRDGKIVGCGSISGYWDSMDESILLTIFVLPEYHGMGIGRTIIKTLEEDELFLKSRRIEIPASVTAVEFYRKLGYDYKNGEKKTDGEGHYRLEKFRKTEGDKH